MREFNIKFLVASILVVLVGVGFLIYFLQTSSTMTSQENAIASLNTQVNSYRTQANSIADQLNAANVKVSSLTTQNTALQTNLNSVQPQLTAANAQVSDLQGQLTAAKTQLTSVQGQLAAASTQATSSGTQVATLQNQVASLQSQLDAANAQVNSDKAIMGLNATTNVANGAAINQIAGQEKQVISFVADYAGYVSISGTATTPTGYVRVTETFSGYAANNNRYYFGMGTTLIVPVLPGTVNIYFGNSDTAGETVTGSLNALYYY
jgi:septal ring factor EnvC (AmiA/AmiB activator)